MLAEEKRNDNEEGTAVGNEEEAKNISDKLIEINTLITDVSTTKSTILVFINQFIADINESMKG